MICVISNSISQTYSVDDGTDDPGVVPLLSSVKVTVDGCEARKLSNMASPTWFRFVWKATRNSCKPFEMISWIWIRASSDRRRPSRCSATFWKSPIKEFETEWSDSSAIATQELIERGNARSSIKYQEIGDILRRNAATALAIHLKRAGSIEQRRPLDIIDRPLLFGEGGKQTRVHSVKNA